MKIALHSALPMKPDSASPEAKLKEVAALYEKEFMRQMVKSMRSTVGSGGLVKENQTEKLFTEELYNNYAEQMSDRGDQQLRKHIYQNLLQQFGARLGVKQEEQFKGIMPLPSSLQKNAKMQDYVIDSQTLMRKIDLSEKGPNSWELTLPFAGQVTSLHRGEDQEFSIIEIKHDHQIQSQFRFLGEPKVKVGDYLQSHKKIAELSQSAKSLIWEMKQGL